MRLFSLTGAKLPDPACYGHTQFHLVPDRYHRDRMARRQQSDQVEVFLRANGLASLFAWTGAQAMYQGGYRVYIELNVVIPQSFSLVTSGQKFTETLANQRVHLLKKMLREML